MPRIPDDLFHQRKEKFLNDLIAIHGKDAIITRAQLIEQHSKDPDNYPHYCFITNDSKYKVGRGHFKLLEPKVRPNYNLKELMNIVGGPSYNDKITQDDINGLCGHDDLMDLI